VSPLGAGGMGEVYRATDTKLGRDVAIKLLPGAFAADPDRLARFEREAKVLASRNHPGIAHLYGFEGATLADGTTAHFLAMDLVEGEDLAERLKRGAVPVDEALAIARQIAEALEEAHERGIVHRDLKPANVKVTVSGVAMFSVARDGLLVYVPGDDSGADAPIDVVDRAGQVTRLKAPPANWGSLAYSPDGGKLPMVVASQTRTNVWTYDIERDVPMQLTFDDLANGAAIWTPDGRRITYASAAGGLPNLYWKAADGSGEAERLTTDPQAQRAGSWSPGSPCTRTAVGWRAA